MRLYLRSATLALLLAGRALAQAPTAIPDAPASQDTELVRISIEPSRSHSMLGTRLGLVGEIRNAGKTPLRFYERETVFMIPPETRIYGSENLMQGCAVFPTERVARPQPADPRGYDVVVQPGESYRVFYDVGSDSCAGTNAAQQLAHKGSAWGWWKQYWQRVLFVPGTYRITLTLKFYDARGDAATYHTAAQSRDVVIAAPQTIILMAAALGGVLAWLVKRYMPQRQGAAPLPPMAGATRAVVFVRTWVLEIVGAALLSLVLVILAATLPEAFPIKVNATDFWGTLALGFLANYSGMALLQRITGTVADPEPAPVAPGGGGRGTAMLPHTPEAAGAASTPVAQPTGAVAVAAGASSATQPAADA